MPAPPAVESPTAPPAARGGGVGEGPPRCAACDGPVRGPYCHACGERRPRPEDESLGHFLREQFHEVTSADGRMWRSFKALFVPGKLTEEYFAGRRGRYLRPVRLFLVLNVLFFIWAGWLEVRGLVGEATLYRSVGNFARRMAEATAAAGVSNEAFDAAFSQRARTLAPTFIAVFVPALTCVLALVLAPARRSLVRHAVFATHSVAALMVMLVAASTVLALPLLVVEVLQGVIAYNLDDSILLPVFLTLWSVYLVVGIRNVYDVPWWGAVASGLATSTLGTLVALEVYRTALFAVTLWTVDVPAPPG